MQLSVINREFFIGGEIMIDKDAMARARVILFDVCGILLESGSTEAQKIAVIIAASLVADRLGRLGELYELAISMQHDIDEVAK